jgi:membrane fusion protein (multidrug efflux system)
MNFLIEAVLSDGTVVPTTGVIDFSNPAIQQSTGTMLFRAVIPNPKLLIYPGQFVKVIVKGAIRPNAIAVPQTAVMQNENGTFVYTIENGLAKMKNVQAGEWYKNYWIIDSGLSAGDIVITQGTVKVKNNRPVSIQTLLPSEIK